MNIKNKISAVLNNKSGVSLLFVIGILGLLLAIGGSVMAAASANFGSNNRQNQYNRAVILNNSIQRNIMHSLQADQTNVNSLAYNIANALYLNYAAVPRTQLAAFELELAGVTVPPNTFVTVRFDMQNGRIIPDGVELNNADPPEEVRRPRKVEIEARMTVEVAVIIDSMSPVPRFLTTHATYTYSGSLTDNGTWPGGTMSFNNPGADPGDWVLVNYEIHE